MIELTKLFMAKPLQGIVAGLVVLSLFLHLSLLEVEEAMAIVQERQKVNLENSKEDRELLYKDHRILIRIDENLKILLKDREHTYAN